MTCSFFRQGSVNSDVIEALMLNYACFTAAAKSITLILPYLPYCTQSRMHGRSGVPLNLLAAIVKSSGVCRVVSIDLYRKELQGFFQLPVENLRASPFLIRAIQENVSFIFIYLCVIKYPLYPRLLIIKIVF